MKRQVRLFALAFTGLLAALPAGGQVPDQLKHSIPAPLAGLQPSASLGDSVAVDAGYTVIGAPFDDVGGRDSGIVKVFDSTTGALLFLLINPGAPDGDSFGISVAISGTRVVVGAMYDDTGAKDAGSAYVYDLSGSTPTVPIATLNNPRPAVDDRFGNSVGISDTRVVVGAYQDDTGATDTGGAYVYDLSSGTPTVPVATLKNPTHAATNLFGWSVAISGTQVVVGAFLDSTGATWAGSVYVYDLTSATPTTPAVTLNNPAPGVNDWFGYSVAISGTRVVVGALYDDLGATDAGGVYVFDLSSALPTVPVTTLNNPGPTASTNFGYSVAVSGTRVVVGAPSEIIGGTGAGSAYVYDLGSGTPTVPMVMLNNPTPAEGTTSASRSQSPARWWWQGLRRTTRGRAARAARISMTSAAARPRCRLSR